MSITDVVYSATQSAVTVLRYKKKWLQWGKRYTKPKYIYDDKKKSEALGFFANKEKPRTHTCRKFSLGFPGISRRQIPGKLGEPGHSWLSGLFHGFEVCAKKPGILPWNSGLLFAGDYW